LVGDEPQEFASCECTDRPRWQEMPSGTRAHHVIHSARWNAYFVFHRNSIKQTMDERCGCTFFCFHMPVDEYVKACCSGTRTVSQIDFCSVNKNSFFHISLLLLSGVEPCPISWLAVTHVMISIVRKHCWLLRITDELGLLNDADNYYYTAVLLNGSMILELWWKDFERGKLKYSGKEPLSRQLQPSQIPHGLIVIEARPLRR
jgi:hypothetical protein